MGTSKESLLMAEDSRTRDAILFDMMHCISCKLDKMNRIEERVEQCEGDITCIRRIGCAIATLLGVLAAWFGLGQH